MKKKEEIICDFTTGVCGPADASEGVVEFVDLSAKEDKDEKEQKQDEK